MKVPTEAELTEESALEVILAAQPPPGLVSASAFVALTLGHGLAGGPVFACLLIAATEGGWPEFIPPWLAWTMLPAYGALATFWLRQTLRRNVFQTASTALGAWRSKDERLSVVGSMCDVLRQRLQGDVDSQSRLSQVEARLHVLVGDELRVGRAMATSPPDASSPEAAAGAALAQEIDRLVAGISGLHAALVSPSPPPNALEWLERKPRWRSLALLARCNGGLLRSAERSERRPQSG